MEPRPLNTKIVYVNHLPEYCPVMANNDSVLSQAAFQSWKLNTSLNDNSELSNLLTTMTRTKENQLDLRCKGCSPVDSSCNCTLEAIAAENTFQVFLVLQSKRAFGTEWCPHTAIKSDFFFCDEAKTEKISAKLRCDATVHCSLNGFDESQFVCNPGQIKLFSYNAIVLFFSLALVSGTYIVFSIDPGTKKEAITKFTIEQIAQITNALRLIKTYVQSPELTIEENMTKGIRKLPKKTQLEVVKVTHYLEANVNGTTEKLFEPALQSMFLKKSERKNLLALVKESSNTSLDLKMDVLDALDSQGWEKKTKTAMERKISWTGRITLEMLSRTCMMVLNVLVTPLQEIKDLGMILAMKIFFQEVIQERVELVDNVPLQDFIIVLSVIYFLLLVLKLLNAFASSTSCTRDTAHSCNLKLLGCWFNPHLIPFVTEVVITMRTFQSTLKEWNLKLKMKGAMDLLDSTEDTDEQAKAWATVLTSAEQLDKEIFEKETLANKKRQIKITSCTGP